MDEDDDVRCRCPENALYLIEEAWNAYPHCLTVLTNGYLSKKKFFISIESMHLPGAGEVENALNLSTAELKGRTVELYVYYVYYVIIDKDVDRRR
jgi:hypothetical protein